MRAASVPPLRLSALAPTQTSTHVRVELFHRSHFRRLFAIESSVFADDRYSLELFQRLCDDNRDLLLVARKGTRTIGYVMGEETPFGAEIVSLAVSPPYRSRGVGRKLLRRLLQRLSRKGIHRVFLMVRETNAAAIHLYRSLGFRRIRRVAEYYADGEVAIRMRLELF